MVNILNDLSRFYRCLFWIVQVFSTLKVPKILVFIMIKLIPLSFDEMKCINSHKQMLNFVQSSIECFEKGAYECDDQSKRLFDCSYMLDRLYESKMFILKDTKIPKYLSTSTRLLLSQINHSSTIEHGDGDEYFKWLKKFINLRHDLRTGKTQSVIDELDEFQKYIKSQQILRSFQCSVLNCFHLFLRWRCSLSASFNGEMIKPHPGTYLDFSRCLGKQLVERKFESVSIMNTVILKAIYELSEMFLRCLVLRYGKFYLNEGLKIAKMTCAFEWYIRFLWLSARFQIIGNCEEYVKTLELTANLCRLRKGSLSKYFIYLREIVVAIINGSEIVFPKIEECEEDEDLASLFAVDVIELMDNGILLRNNDYRLRNFKDSLIEAGTYLPFFNWSIGMQTNIQSEIDECTKSFASPIKFKSLLNRFISLPIKQPTRKNIDDKSVEKNQILHVHAQALGYRHFAQFVCGIQSSLDRSENYCHDFVTSLEKSLSFGRSALDELDYWIKSLDDHSLLIAINTFAYSDHEICVYVTRVSKNQAISLRLNVQTKTFDSFDEVIRNHCKNLNDGGEVGESVIATPRPHVDLGHRKQIDDRLRKYLCTIDEKFISIVAPLFLVDDAECMKEFTTDMKRRRVSFSEYQKVLIGFLLKYWKEYGGMELRREVVPFIDSMRTFLNSIGHHENQTDRGWSSICEKVIAYFSGLDKSTKSHDENTIYLLIDSRLSRIPFESCRILSEAMRSNQIFITRMHSLAFLNAYLKAQKFVVQSPVIESGVDCDNGGYLIDVIVEDRKAVLMKFFEQKLNWFGCVAREEDCEGELRYHRSYADMLISKDVVVYAGHGCGAHYMSFDMLRRLLIRSGVLLMGCSSVEHKYTGIFEGYGAPCAYLLSGCPFVIGTLWDVTDVDTDRFTACVLDKWAKIAANIDYCRSVGSMMVTAKKKCVLKYANGAAFVTYGLPVRLKRRNNL
ncbi:hypothetical protein ACOME3_006172 [Neoechinorhynchus agilis]